MKNFEELNFYEILEISADASPFKIKRAYKNALEVYGKESLLTYSLFSEGERIDILKRIEHAYNTLIDKAKRNAYDAWLGGHSGGILRQAPRDYVRDRQDK
jgi:DnaJ-class molecular chaperone